MADAQIPPNSPIGNTARACRNCAYWLDGLSDFVTYAECHRNPPAYSLGLVSGESAAGFAKGEFETITCLGAAVWPKTHMTNSCGEFKARSSAAKYLWEAEA